VLYIIEYFLFSIKKIKVFVYTGQYILQMNSGMFQTGAVRLIFITVFIASFFGMEFCLQPVTNILKNYAQDIKI